MLLKIIFTVLTLLTVVACFSFCILGIVKATPILAVSCGALGIGFGIFSYADARYWIYYFKNKSVNK